MERYEMAEVLSKKAGVSLEDAKKALEENDWDMLDAMVALERARGGARTVNVEPDGEQPPRDERPREPQPVKNVSQREPFFSNGFRVMWDYIKRLAAMSVDNSFVAVRRGKVLIRVPVLVLLILAVGVFWLTIPVLVIGLFCNVTYRFEGRELGRESVNKAMESVSGVAEDIKEAFKSDSGSQTGQ